MVWILLVKARILGEEQYLGFGDEYNVMVEWLTQVKIEVKVWH